MKKKQTRWAQRSLPSNVINTSRIYNSICEVNLWSSRQEGLGTVRDPRQRQHFWKNPTFVAINSLVRLRSEPLKPSRLKQKRIQIWDQVFTIAARWGIVKIRLPVFWTSKIRIYLERTKMCLALKLMTLSTKLYSIQFHGRKSKHLDGLRKNFQLWITIATRLSLNKK